MSGDSLRDIVLRMEGAMNTGFATVAGEINLLRRDDADVADEVASLRTDVDDLKGRRWPLPVIGGLVAFSSLGMSAFTLIKGG